MKRPASLVVVILLILMATGQLIRFIMKVSIVVAGIEIPVWPSGVVAVILALLAVWLLKERSS